MNFDGKIVLVRAHLAGVFVGRCVGEPTQERAELAAARRLYSWRSALCVETIATHGVSTESRVSDPCDQVVFGPIVQVIPCTEAAAAQIASLPIAR